MLTFHPFDQDFIDALRAGGPDANGQPAERAISDGKGKPCRSCLNDVPAGAAMLICAARPPFPTLQPFAETGPVFFCADHCKAYDAATLPPILQSAPDDLLKAYSADHRIVYGTGQVTPRGNIAASAAQLLEMDLVAFVDVRSARNNCFQTRISRIP